MKKITLYLMDHYVKRLFILTMGILSLVYLITFVELIRKVDSRETASLMKMLYLTAAQLGPVIDKVLPFLILLASLWSLFSLLKTSELIILKTASVSLWRIGLVYVGVSVCVVSVYIAIIMPFLASMHQEYRFWERNRVQIYQDIYQKVQSDDKHNIFLKAQSYDGLTHGLEKVYVTILEGDHLIKAIYFARKGHYDPEAKKIIFPQILALKTDNAFIEAPSKVTDFNLPIDLSFIKRAYSSKKIMTHIYEYKNLIENQKKQKLSFINLQNLFYALLTLPISCGLYSFIAVTALPNLYRGLQGTKNMLGAIIGGLAFYIADNWIMAIAPSNNIPTIIALFAVKISVLMLCIVIIFNKEYGFRNHKKSLA